MSHGNRNGLGYLCQPAIGIRVCAKQTLANGLFNEREGFFGFSGFGFSHLGAKLYGRQLIFLGFNTRLGLLKGSARILQLTFCSDDEFTLRPLGGLSSHFGNSQFLQGARAKRLGAGLGLAGVLFHTAKDIGRLRHQIEGCCAAVAY